MKSKVVSALKAQFDADVREVKWLNREMERTRSAYLAYQELERWIGERQERIRRLVMLFRPHGSSSIKRDVQSRARELGIKLPEGWETVSTWEAVQEVVRQFPSVQMVDLLRWLETDLGLSVSRQSVDSALGQHGDVFETKRSSKCKYVSLKSP